MQSAFPRRAVSGRHRLFIWDCADQEGYRKKARPDAVRVLRRGGCFVRGPSSALLPRLTGCLFTLARTTSPGAAKIRQTSTSHVLYLRAT